MKTDQSPLALGLSTNPVISEVPPASAIKIPTTTPATAATSSTTVAAVKPAAIGTKATTSTPANSGVIPVSTAGNAAVPAVATAERINNYAATHSNGGFFSGDFSAAGKSASGQAGTFKSTSGWTDGKYYALMNGVPVGTIIHVTAQNSKAVYAKVLGQLPDMKESSGLLIRISNAASAELGLGEGRFAVEVKY